MAKEKDETPAKEPDIKLDTKAQATPPTLTEILLKYEGAFARKGDHVLHSKVNEVLLAAHALKQRIKALEGKVDADLTATLASVDSAL